MKPKTCLLAFAVLALAACAQVDTVQNAQGIAAPLPTRANAPPTIGGQPELSIEAGSAYRFAPTASDTDGDALLFSIDNKPAWASFNVATGVLSGVPVNGDEGSYPGIVVRVSDGRASLALPAFAITVKPRVPAISNNGVASMAWTVPTHNTDGTVLSDLAGYWIYHGTSAGNLARLQQVTNPATTQFQATGLASGTHYFAITAYSIAGTESVLSAVGSKDIP